MFTKGLSRLALLLCLSFTALPAWATSTLTYSSNGGPQTTYTDADGSFTVSGVTNALATGAFVSFVKSSPFILVQMEFLPLANQTLATGVYDNTQSAGSQGPMNPGLYLFNIGNSCSSPGRFQVRAITWSGPTTISSLAVDFQQSCSNGVTNTTVVGSYRFNDSTPIHYTIPTADAGPNQAVPQGATVTLDGSLSDGGSGNIARYAWTQTQGTTVVLSDPTAVKPTFTAPNESPGAPEHLQFTLAVTNDHNVTSTLPTTVDVLVSNPADPVWALQISGDAGTTLNGSSLTVTPLQAAFTSTKIAAIGNYGAGFQVHVNSGPNSYYLDFEAPKGQTLQVGGTYDILPITGVAYMSASGYGICSGSNQRFLVRDLQTDGAGNLTALAVDFELTCGSGQAKVHGVLRYDSTIALSNAWAAAGVPQVVVQGSTVTLSGSESEAGSGGDSITGYQWTQTGGPTVTLSDATAANPTFTAPAVGAGGADLTFQLTVTTADGLSSTDTVTVHVGNTADPATMLMVDSQPGDTIASGNSTVLNSLDSSFTTHFSSGNQYVGASISTSVSGPAGSNWIFNVTLPLGQPLQPGTYAVGSGAQIYVSGGSGTCYSPVGSFTILDLQTGSGSTINSVAMDLDVRCDSNATGDLLLKFRYNDAANAYEPVADAGAFQNTVEGATVDLSAGASDGGGPGASITSYQWTQLSGPSISFSDATAESPTFTAPSVTPGGADLVLQVTITNFLGLTGSATVRVHVADSTDPAPQIVLYAVPDTGYGLADVQTTTVNGTSQDFTLQQWASQLNLELPNWAIQLYPPTGLSLQSGTTYKLAQDGSGHSPVLPGLGIDIGDEGCTVDSARFAVLQQELDAHGNILALAVDFEQRCAGFPGFIHGAYRYNSAVALNAPFADAGLAQIVPQEATVNLDGSQSYAGGGTDTVASYAWTQLSGPAVTLSDTTVAAPSFTAPDVSAGGADLVFQLTVVNSDGRSGSDTVNVHVANPADPVTVLRVSGDPGNYMTQGKTWTENTLVAAFVGSKSSPAGNDALFSIEGGSFGEWSIKAVAPTGQVLTKGTTYNDVQDYYSQATAPRLSVSNGDGCTTDDGEFVVKDISVSSDGTITSLALDFDQYCRNSTAGLHGKLRYNSTYPIDDPVAHAGPTQAVTQGDTVTLDGSATDPGGDGTTITGWQWTQIGTGTTVTLSDPTAESPTFTAPAGSGDQTLTFELTVTNSLGLTSTQDVTITVQDPSAPHSGIYVQGTSDDFTDPASLLAREPLQGPITASTPSANAVTVSYTGPDSKVWSLTFVPPQGQQFHTGTYTNVTTAAPDQSVIGTSPGVQAEMLVNDVPDWESCPAVSGQFTVEQVSYDGSGNVTAFAADFKQVCSDQWGDTAVMRGKVRYQSTVTLREPLAVAGSDHLAFAGLTATLDGSASSTPAGTVTGYSWTQVVASGDPVVSLSSATAAKPSFTAPNLVTDRTLTFQLTVTNSFGLTDQDVVHVQVVGSSEPKTGFYYQSDVDDPDGQGATALATTSDGEIYADGRYGAINANIYPSGATGFNQPWEFTFTGGDQTLHKGVYSAEPGYNFGIPELIATAGACDETGGMFVVRDISYDQFGEIASFAADFVRHCQGAVGDLRGALRINSTVPMIVKTPAAAPGPPATVTQATSLTLDGSNSFPGWSTITSYSWKQVGGPAVGLSRKSQAKAQVNIPSSVLTNPGTVLTFALTVTNANGLSDTETTTVTALLPAYSTLTMQSDAGDPVGLGYAWGYWTSASDTTILVAGQGGSVTAKVLYKGYPGWSLQFAVPRKQVFKDGSYTGAVKFSSMLAKPSLYVNLVPTASPCRAVAGDFKVLDVVVKNGTIASLAVDFDQTCNGANGALHGKLRYHTAVP